MPLTVNVSLGRKSSRDFQSSNTSISISAELDQTLLAKPQRLQAEIDGLFAQARVALDGQRNEPPVGCETAAARVANGHARRQSARHDGGNGHPNGSAGVGGGGPMTASQRRAINAIATRLAADPHVECRQLHGTELDVLTVRQASELIDHLKACAPTNGR